MLRSERLQKSFVERVVFETDVEYRLLSGEVFSAPSSDLSAGGLYLNTENPLAIEDTINLSFSISLNGKTITISCLARVAWKNHEGPGRLKLDYPAGVGIEFLSLSREEHATLSEYIDSYDEHKKMNMVCAWCGKNLGLRKGPHGKTSHGICNPCRASISRQHS